ncbi:MAG: hypothetical protein WBP94_14790 [Rhodomicrobiaceae bacterium]
MFARLCGAAIIAALVSLSSASSYAQQQPGPSSQNAGSYLPPAHLIAKEEHAKASQKSAPAKREAGVKTIGLISIVGETFTVKKIGIMVFGNEEKNFPIANWKIDDRVAATVTRILKKNFKTKRITIPAGAFETFTKGNFIFKSFEAELAKFVARYTAGQNCDYYLLVSPGYSQISNTNQGIYGLGVVRWDHIFNPGEHVHALTVLTVYDSHMTQMRSEFSSIGQEGFLAGMRGPHRELKAGERLPADANAVVRDPRTQQITWELLDKSLVMTVPKLFAAN